MRSTFYILPFDHRGSFQKRMFGWSSPLNEPQTAAIAAAKRVIYRSARRGRPQGGGRHSGGRGIRRRHPARCRSRGYRHRLPVRERTGREKAQLDGLKGDKRAYDHKLRPQMMVGAIEELQAAGVDPDVWKIEGLERREDCERIVAAARAGGRDRVGCIILGRGEDDATVREWFATAAGVAGFIGFAVGRTVFWDPVADWRAKKVTREAAVAEIARRYHEFVEVYEAAAPPAATRVQA